MPPAFSSMLRVVRLGYRAEPRLLLASFAMTLLQALPDALVALWLALITNGLVHHDHTRLLVGAFGLAASATLMWALQVTLTRTIRRLGDRLNIMFQGYVARLQAEVATVEHHERPVYLDRIAVLRTGVFALDHLFGSMFTMVGWLVRLAFVSVLLAAINPGLLLLLPAAVPLLLVAVWRPKVEKRAEESVASDARLGRHVFQVATSTPPGKEIRVTGNQARPGRAPARGLGRVLRDDPGQPSSPPRPGRPLAWAFFSLAFVAAVVWVATGPRRHARGGGPGAHRRRPAVGVRRLGGRRAGLPARHLARLRPAPGLARGVRRRAERPHRPAGARAARAGRGLRGRLVRLPRHHAHRARARRPGAARRQRGRRRRRERRGQVARWSSCWPGCTRRPPDGSRPTASTSTAPTSPVARAARGRVPGLRPARVHGRDHRRPG